MYVYISKKIGNVYASLDNHHQLGSGLFEDIGESIPLGEDMVKMLYPNAKINGIGSVKLPTDKELDKRGPLKWNISKQAWVEV